MELVEAGSDTAVAVSLSPPREDLLTVGPFLGPPRAVAARRPSGPSRDWGGAGRWTLAVPEGGRPPWKRPVVACCSFAARTHVWRRRRSALERPPNRFSTMSWASLFGSTALRPRGARSPRRRQAGAVLAAPASQTQRRPEARRRRSRRPGRESTARRAAGRREAGGPTGCSETYPSRGQTATISARPHRALASETCQASESSGDCWSSVDVRA